MLSLKALSPYKYLSVNAPLNFCWKTADGSLLSHNCGNIDRSERQIFMNPWIFLRNFLSLISITINGPRLFGNWKEVDIGHKCAIYVESSVPSSFQINVVLRPERFEAKLKTNASKIWFSFTNQKTRCPYFPDHERGCWTTKKGLIFLCTKVLESTLF